ncbi:MAG: hypothetical protein HY904_17620 [Deltaproteobacteria bacterium]|nr:hypothetical protein [Deltaproteobacteria bacterium]
MKRTAWVVGAALWAAACLGPVEGEHPSAAALTGGRPGEIALVPVVNVDGLEALTNRSVGTVFVNEVLLNATDVRLWDGEGNRRSILAEPQYLLRYDPAAGETGLSRLWAPADGRYQTLTLDVGPLTLSHGQAQEEARARGFDISDLAGASVLIRGVMVTETAGPQAQLLHATSTESGSGCPEGDSQCEGTVPDTAPADGPVAVDNGTVPDTAPARDEVGSQAGGLAGKVGAAMPMRTYRAFSLVSTGAFMLGTNLDPLVMEGGGAVTLHLDVDALFTDERIAELRQAVRDQRTGDIVRTVNGAELSGSVSVHSKDVNVNPIIRR